MKARVTVEPSGPRMRSATCFLRRSDGEGWRGGWELGEEGSASEVE